MKKKIEELNLIDNFLFGVMVSYPEVGESFVRILLKIIFDRDFGRVKLIPQKEDSGADTDLHGTRLDLYVFQNDFSLYKRDAREIKKKFTGTASLYGGYDS